MSIPKSTSSSAASPPATRSNPASHPGTQNAPRFRGAFFALDPERLPFSTAPYSVKRGVMASTRVNPLLSTSAPLALLASPANVTVAR